MTDKSIEEFREKIEALLENEEDDQLLDMLEACVDPDEKFYLLEAALQIEAYDQVIEHIEAAVGAQDEASDARLWMLMGFARYYQDDLEDAQEAFTKAIKLDPMEVRALMGRALVFREIDFERAARLDLDRALMLLEDVTPDTEDAEIRALKAEVFNAQATMAIDDEDHEATEAALRHAVDVCPEDATYGLDLARHLTLTGKIKEALEALNAAIDADDLLLEAQLLKSYVLGALGQTKAAVQTARDAVDLDDEEPYSLLQLANALMLDGRFEEVLATAEQAIALEPELPDGYQIKMAALHGLGRSEEATDDMEPYFEELADLPNFLFGERFDPYADAASSLSEMVNMSPDDLMKFSEQFFATGQLPQELKPVMDQILQNLPDLLQQMPGLAQMMPPEIAAQLSAPSPGPAAAPSRPSLTVIPGGKTPGDEG